MEPCVELGLSGWKQYCEFTARPVLSEYNQPSFPINTTLNLRKHKMHPHTMKSEVDTYNDVEYSGLDMRPMRRKHLNVSSFSAGFAASILLTAIALFTYRTLSIPKTAAEIEAEEWNYCGRSSVIAMERGCVMEPMFYGWMPPQCVYQELTDSLPIFEDRNYFRCVEKFKLQHKNIWTDDSTVMRTWHNLYLQNSCGLANTMSYTLIGK